MARPARLILEHVSDTINRRLSEWLLAAQLATLGWIFLLPGSSFAISHAYDRMALWAGEQMWGMGLLTLGAVRLAVLAINGYMYRSPHLRGFFAFLACGVWTLMFLGVLLTWQPSASLSWFGWSIIFEIVIIGRAFKEAGRRDARRRV